MKKVELQEIVLELLDFFNDYMDISLDRTSIAETAEDQSPMKKESRFWIKSTRVT